MSDIIPKPSCELRLGGLRPSRVSFEENGFLMHFDVDQDGKAQLDRLLDSGEWADVLLSTVGATFKSGKSMVRTYKFLGRVVTMEKIADGYAVRFHTFGAPEVGSVEL